MKITRKIVRIDEEKCNGCGRCASACAEQAIVLVNGKARLVSEICCDGLGACLGHCPQDAITIEEREAEVFDDNEVRQRLARPPSPVPSASVCRVSSPAAGGCPGSRVGILNAALTVGSTDSGNGTASALGHWPVQLRLVPPGAAFLRGADVLLAGDCVPFAYADFHRRLLAGHAVLIGCPKLDDTAFYVDKLAQILRAANIRSLSVAVMEVPCCSGLLRIAQMAMQRAGVSVPLRAITVTISGTITAQAIPPLLVARSTA